ACARYEQGPHQAAWPRRLRPPKLGPGPQDGAHSLEGTPVPGVIRWSVWAGTLVIFPAVVLMPGLVLSQLLGFTLREDLVLGCISLGLLLAAGVFETTIYFRELRSLVPKPAASALVFLLRLAAAGFTFEAVLLASYALARGHGLLPAPLPFF